MLAMASWSTQSPATRTTNRSPSPALNTCLHARVAQHSTIAWVLAAQ
jgi:hypothetical protein